MNIKYVAYVLFVTILLNCKKYENNKAQLVVEQETTLQKETIYQFKVVDINGNDFDFSSLKGKKILIVNTASECGLTPQYELLQEIYSLYKDSNFTIVGFPANNFGKQEPGTNEEIAQFCTQNYKVTFPMMGKISVKGNDMHPLYQFLTQKNRNGYADSNVAWNFQKYLINEKGELVTMVKPKVLPTDSIIIDWINN